MTTPPLPTEEELRELERLHGEASYEQIAAHGVEYVEGKPTGACDITDAEDNDIIATCIPGEADPTTMELLDSGVKP